jgi:cysteine desulfurase / selenocysteine lyase
MKLHADFPILNQPLIYLDSGASSLKPAVVIDSMQEYYQEYGVNIHRGVYQMAHRATEAFEHAREVVAGYINAPAKEIVFTRGTSASLNLVAQSIGNTLTAGDEIIVSQLEHHSGLLPWQEVAKRTKARLVFVPLTNEGRITTDNVRSVLTERTKIIALTHGSNVMGYLTPIQEIAALVQGKDIIISLDAAQTAPMKLVDVQQLGCDFISFGAHKMCGPTGVGVLWGSYDRLQAMAPVEFGGEMNDGVDLYDASYKDAPYKFETGTMPIAEVIGFAKAVEYLSAFTNIQATERTLAQSAIDQLSALAGVTVYNTTPDYGIVTFNIDGVHPHDTASYLDEYHIAVRAGHHCCQPLMKWLGVDSTVRATFYIYNEESDVTALVNAVTAARDFFGQF